MQLPQQTSQPPVLSLEISRVLPAGATFQSISPLQATFIKGIEQLGGARPGASSLRLYTRIYKFRGWGWGEHHARAASDSGGQLPLGALAAAVQDEVCAGPRGHGRLRLGALGLGLLLFPCGWTAPGEARPSCSAPPRFTFRPPSSWPRPRPRLHHSPASAARPRPQPPARTHSGRSRDSEVPAAGGGAAA